MLHLNLKTVKNVRKKPWTEETRQKTPGHKLSASKKSQRNGKNSGGKYIVDFRFEARNTRRIRKKNSNWPTGSRSYRWSLFSRWCPYVKKSRSTLIQKQTTMLYGAWWVTKFARLVTYIVVSPLSRQFSKNGFLEWLVDHCFLVCAYLRDRIC